LIELLKNNSAFGELEDSPYISTGIKTDYRFISSTIFFSLSGGNVFDLRALGPSATFTVTA
jgi:hypothetical protein